MKFASVLTVWVGCYIPALAFGDGTPVYCSKPMAIPDAWTDLNHNGLFDPGEPYDPLVTGYGTGNIGAQISLRQAHPGQSPMLGMYFPVAFPPLNRGNPLTGEDVYKQWLLTCSPFGLQSGDSLIVELGDVQDTTFAAFLGFINQDPTAYWDESTHSVISPFPNSPRLVTVLGYSPIYSPGAGRNNLILTKFLSLFVESLGPSSQINLRIVDATTDGSVATIPITWGTLKSKY
jgi:hypothetical protein